MELPRDRLYLWLTEWFQKHDYSPSIRDMQHGLGYKSTATIQFMLKGLRRNGFIDFEDGKNRTVRLLHPVNYRISFDDDIARVFADGRWFELSPEKTEQLKGLLENAKTATT